MLPEEMQGIMRIDRISASGGVELLHLPAVHGQANEMLSAPPAQTAWPTCHRAEGTDRTAPPRSSPPTT